MECTALRWPEKGHLGHLVAASRVFQGLVVLLLVTFGPEKAHFEEGAGRLCDYCLFPPPDGGVFHAVALEVVDARLLKRRNTIVPKKINNILMRRTQKTVVTANF